MDPLDRIDSQRPEQLSDRLHQAASDLALNPMLDDLLRDPQIARQINDLAYLHWVSRGKPEGSPEIDWRHAVQEVLRQREWQFRVLGEFTWLQTIS